MAKELVPLRDFQARGMEALYASIESGKKAPLMCYPTGAGKTVMALHGMAHFLKMGMKQLFIAPRRDLVTQTQRVLFENGLHAGILMAGEPRSRFASIQIATKQTLQPMLARGYTPPADVVWQDEAHLSLSDGFETIMSHYKDAIKIGLTATPARTDGRGLGEIYDDLIIGPSIGELIDQGHLVPLFHFDGGSPDLKGVRSVGGDFDQKQLGERCDTPKLIGDVVANWLKWGENRKTIVFNISVAHSLHVAQAFNEAGIKAEHIDGSMSSQERSPIVDRFRNGDTTILCNCMLVEFGWDVPIASCIVLNKPTKSLSRYLQMVGRGTRKDPASGKENTIVIDHGANIARFGPAYEKRDWSLDGKEKIQDREKRKKESKEQKGADEPKTLTCPNEDCGCKFEAKHVVDNKYCPICETQVVFPPRKQPAPVEFIPADLVPVERGPVLVSSMAAREQFYRELLFETRQRGWSDGAAAHSYRERFGDWPTFSKIPLEPRDNKARAWIDSRLRALRFGGQRTKRLKRSQ